MAHSLTQTLHMGCREAEYLVFDQNERMGRREEKGGRFKPCPESRDVVVSGSCLWGNVFGESSCSESCSSSSQLRGCLANPKICSDEAEVVGLFVIIAAPSRGFLRPFHGGGLQLDAMLVWGRTWGVGKRMFLH